ncbi:hypothetical protein MMC14_004554 [Varicellaria rhodocarpa]|nr:hypothetical protein [Varicellaria rhodocarpa]
MPHKPVPAVFTANHGRRPQCFLPEASKTPPPTVTTEAQSPGPRPTQKSPSSSSSAYTTTQVPLRSHKRPVHYQGIPLETLNLPPPAQSLEDPIVAAPPPSHSQLNRELPAVVESSKKKGHMVDGDEFYTPPCTPPSRIQSPASSPPSRIQSPASSLLSRIQSPVPSPLSKTQTPAPSPPPQIQASAAPAQVQSQDSPYHVQRMYDFSDKRPVVRSEPWGGVNAKKSVWTGDRETI